MNFSNDLRTTINEKREGDVVINDGFIKGPEARALLYYQLLYFNINFEVLDYNIY